ncbi:hypothetical protein EDD36DRAFT_159654 [Exophiala viscosa]|uniref:NAD(P)-binding protein n=1 Tax=Exophiala viscosa TaxID=2486360 RepID=A0AAN6IHI0_9EURO|nr:hypothetical protein EDD36DRAFT_159654 [Exophiala viscosa]
MARLNWSPSSLPSLKKRTYIVTGGNTGIGYWTVHHLALHGATVFMTCRTEEKGKAALAALQSSIKQSNPSITPDIRSVTMDLMSLRSVREATTKILSEITQLHGIVNSAGIMATPYAMSEDDYESQFQTNYLSHWLLTYLLLPLLESTAAASNEPGTVRIVNVSSIGHTAAPKEGINFADTALTGSFTFRRYGQSKLANILHAKSLHARYNRATTSSSNKILALSLHPGNVDTQLNTQSWGAALVPVLRCLGVYITPEEGSFNSLWAVASPQVTVGISGEYFVPVGVKKEPSKLARDAQLADKLWNWTEQELRSKGLLQ